MNEIALDCVPEFAARNLDASVVCLTLVDRSHRLWTGSYGVSAPSALLISWSFMKRVVATRRPLVLTDGRRDPVAARFPAVRDGTVTAYVGLPLLAPEGRAVGTLSVMDRRPRRWSAPQLTLLQCIASRVERQIELGAGAPGARTTRGAGAAPPSTQPGAVADGAHADARPVAPTTVRA